MWITGPRRSPVFRVFLRTNQSPVYGTRYVRSQVLTLALVRVLSTRVLFCCFVALQVEDDSTCELARGSIYLLAT
jgi:hypothetical protein